MYKYAYIAALALAACQDPKPTDRKVTAEDLKHDAAKTIDTAQKLAAQTKAEYIAKTEEKLKQLDRDLDALKADVDKKKGAAKKAAEDQLQELRKQRAALGAELEALRKESGEKWDAAQKKLDQTSDAFDAAYRELRKRLEGI
jgi:hypothetical protein